MNLTREVLAIFSELENKGFLTARRQQIDLASQISHCLVNNKHLIAEAGTGVGKTLAYLIPFILTAIRLKKKVIISTSSITLQKQIINKELPLIQNVLPFNFAVSLGSSNYFCERKLLQGVQLGLFGEQEDMHALEQIHFLKNSDYMATIQDCDFMISESLRQRICRDRHSCAGPACNLKSRCAYVLNGKSQSDSQVIVMNHHKILNLIKNGSKSLENVAGIVFDECHHLEEIASAVFSDSIDSSTIKTLIRELYNRRTEKGLLSKIRLPYEHKDRIIKNINSIAEKFYLYQAAATQNDDQDMSDQDFEFLKDLQASILDLRNHLTKNKIEVLLPYAARSADLVDTIDDICSMKEGFIYWRRIADKGWSFSATPLSVGKLLNQALFRSGKITTAHLSATVAIWGKMSLYRHRCGISNAVEKIVSTPFDYAKQVQLYIPTAMPEPDTEEYHSASIREMEKLMCHFNGRVLILFTGYAAMESVYNSLITQLPEYNYFKQGDMATPKLIEKFKSTEKAVMLGALTFWEGVDIPREALKAVVITKLPFPLPTDPVARARRKELELKGKKAFWYYDIPSALIPFMQGFGRLIRTESDSGIVAILDSRIITRQYRRIFLSSLPKCRIINDFNGIDK